MSSLDITLLGTFSVRAEDHETKPFSTAKARALCAYLAIEGMRPLERTHLAGLLWPDRTEDSARGSLRHALSNIRKGIGDQTVEPPYLLMTRRTVQLNPDALKAGNIRIDVVRFQTLYQKARNISQASTEAATEVARGAAIEALDLYQGPFFNVDLLVDSPEFDSWAQLQREMLHRQTADLLTDLLENAMDRGEPHKAVPYAQRLVDHEPWREDAHVQLMNVFWQNGQADMAMRQYDQCRRRLQEELDIDPSPETTTLYEEIRDNRHRFAMRNRVRPAIAAPTGDSVAATPPVPTGSYAEPKVGPNTEPNTGPKAAIEINTTAGASLPLLDEPTGSEQNDPTSVDSVDADTTPPTTRHNIPAQIKEFFGRQREICEIEARLAQPNCRQLTLVGPGGMGKTQLAMEIARRQLEHFSDGVWFVPLAGVADGSQIPAAILSSLEVPIAADQDPEQSLYQYLQERTLLLVLDNYEHLFDNVLLVPQLLNHAHQLTILVTSRERLNLQAEAVFVLDGLDLPPLEQLLLEQPTAPPQNEGEGSAETSATERTNALGKEATQPIESSAVALFIDCAQRADVSFTLADDDRRAVVEICYLIDGMPLGIELAAVWTRMLSCQEILENLRRSIDILTVTMPDIPARHRCMRVLFEESWQNLTPEAQQIFEKASIFRGGFDWAALAYVAEAAMHHVVQLMDRGLLRKVSNGSYQIHELMRQFGAEKLAAVPKIESETATRHAQYYLNSLEDIEAALISGSGAAVGSDLPRIIENVRTAWQWAVAQKQIDFIRNTLTSLSRVYEWSGRFEDGANACGAASTIVSAKGEPRLRVRLLTNQASFFFSLARATEAEALLDECEMILTTQLSGDDTRAEMAAVLSMRGRLAFVSNHWATARQFQEQALAIYKELDDRWGIAKVSNALALQLRAPVGVEPLGRFEHLDTIRALAQQSAALSREIGDQAEVAEALLHLAYAEHHSGEIDSALSTIEECVEHCQPLNLQGYLVRAYAYQANLLLGLGRYAEARASNNLSWELVERLGFTYGIPNCIRIFGTIYLGEKQYEQALSELEKSLAMRQERGHSRNVCIMHSYVGIAHYHLGHLKKAREHLIEALELSIQMPTYRQFQFVSYLAALHMVESGELERAIEFYGLSESIAGDSAVRFAEDIVGSTIYEAASGLPQERITAAEERGRSLDATTAAKALLAELT